MSKPKPQPDVQPEKHKLYGGEVTLLYYPDPVHRYEVDGQTIPGVTTIIKDTLPKPALVQWAANLASETWLKDIWGFDKYHKAHTRERIGKEGDDAFTTLTNTTHDLARFAWRTTARQAADIGTAAHDAIAAYLRNYDGYNIEPPMQAALSPDNEKLRNCFFAFSDWWHEKPRKIIAVERIVYSRSLGYAGRFDLLTEEDDELILTDFKSSKGIYDTDYCPQLTGLCKALNEELPFGRPCLNRRIVRLGKEDGSFEVREYDSEYGWDVEAWIHLVNTYGWLKNRFKGEEGE